MNLCAASYISSLQSNYLNYYLLRACRAYLLMLYILALDIEFGFIISVLIHKIVIFIYVYLIYIYIYISDNIYQVRIKRYD